MNGLKKMFRSFGGLAVVLAVCVLSLTMAGCGGTAPSASSSQESSYHVEVTDDLGRVVSLTKKPERIVVTSASFLEPLHVVGGDVVGRPDSKNQMPDYAKDKASVGKVYQIDVEKVLACEPDLVILNKGMNEKLIDTLEANGIKTLVISGKTYEEVKRELELFAQVTGEEQKAKDKIAEMDAQIAEVQTKLDGAEVPRIAILHSTGQGLSVQLDTSIAGSVAQLLNWPNTATGLTPNKKHPDTAPYSLESLVEQNPDVLFVTSMGKIEDIRAGMDKTMQENPAWQTIPAVQKGRVYYLPQDLFLLSPGIHYPEAVREMAHCVYPERFPS